MAKNNFKEIDKDDREGGGVDVYDNDDDYDNEMMMMMMMMMMMIMMSVEIMRWGGNT